MPPAQGFIANNSTTGNIRTPSLGEDGSTNEQFLPVTKLRGQYQDYLGAKVLEIEEQKQGRAYYHGAQWTAEEIRILRARRQPVVTYNRIAKKINAIVGLTERLRQDPKAYPRNPRNDEGADVATQTVKYVLDSNDWKTQSSEVIRQASTEGIGGMAFKLHQGDKGDPDIKLEIVFGDDFFYDCRSNRPDFHDARYLGMAKWVDEDEAVELFPDKEDLIRSLVENGNNLTTYADREFKWIYTKERRVRLVEHWYKHRSKWCWCFYISDTLLDEGVSPFFDDRNKTVPRFVMFSAAVDHDSDRYGFVRNLKGPQDEINQRRSKALFTTNSRRLIADKGAVDDVERARREWARPDGFIEKNPGLSITPDETAADLKGQIDFLMEAKAEIDQSAPASPLMPGAEAMPKNVSGRAINLMQQSGTAELGPFLMQVRGWKLRLYQAIWSTAQRYWTAERWIRVTDDQEMAKFIQINGLDLDEWGRPQLVNYLGALNVDIIMDEGPDAINMQSDALDVIQSAIQSGTNFPPQLVIELLPIPNALKKRALGLLQQPPDPVEQAGKALYVKQMAADITKTETESLKNVGIAIANAAKGGESIVQAKADMAAYESAAPTFQGGAPQPSGPVQGAPAAAPQADQAPLPQAFARFPGGAMGQPRPAPHPAAATMPPPTQRPNYMAGLPL